MYIPLPSFLTIKQSPIHGLGLYTNSEIKSGTRLGRSHFYTGIELIRTPLGGFVNHSDNPNVRVSKERKAPVSGDETNTHTLFLVTMCDIQAGEELVANYMNDQYVSNPSNEIYNHEHI
tara:strand:- start:70 stop:426 length:357 start_codon:yes stop_codon:yes gene_type:complete